MSIKVTVVPAARLAVSIAPPARHEVEVIAQRGLPGRDGAAADTATIEAVVDASIADAGLDLPPGTNFAAIFENGLDEDLL